MPRAAWVCALVAFLNAACWSVISPPFEIPDEPSHFAYVQRLAETGKLPASSAEAFPPAEYTVLSDLHYSQVRYHSEQGTISTPAEQRTLESDLAKPLARSARKGRPGCRHPSRRCTTRSRRSRTPSRRSATCSTRTR